MAKTTGEAAVDEAAATITQADHEAAVSAAREEGRRAGLAASEAAVTEARNEGRRAGHTEGATAERDRILGIEKLGLKGHEALVAQFKADGKTTPAEAAVAIVQAEQAKGGTMLANLKADGATGAASVAAAEPAAAGSKHSSAAILADKTQSLEERCKAAFEADPDIRAEFGKVETLVAYQRAAESGQAKIFRPRQ